MLFFFYFFLGLAGGADAAYIYEEIFSIKDLQRDLYNMASKMCAGVQRGLILRNEKCSDNYNCDFMTRLYAEEGKGIFSARSNIIGMCFILFQIRTNKHIVTKWLASRRNLRIKRSRWFGQMIGA